MKYISFVLSILISVGSAIGMVSQAYASIDVYEFETAEQEARYRGLIDEFRCPKCQNQNLASSDSPIAQDLKRRTYQLIQAGDSDEQIRAYMQTRYGDFINYKPPVKPSTYLLWFLPPVLLVLLIAMWIVMTRKKVTQQQQLASQNKTSTTDKSSKALNAEEKQLQQMLDETNTHQRSKNAITKDKGAS